MGHGGVVGKGNGKRKRKKKNNLGSPGGGRRAWVLLGQMTSYCKRGLLGFV